MDLLPQVQSWLEKQGFSLEMRAASAFRSAGFEVRQSSYYIDAENSKPREMDVIASYPDVMGVIRIALIIECKSSSKPWVLLCSSDTLTGYNIVSSYAAISDEARRILPWLRKNDLTGYSVRQAFSDIDNAYAATLNVAKAVTLFSARTSRHRRSIKRSVLHFPLSLSILH